MVRLTQIEHDREQLWLRALEEYPGGLTQTQLAALVGMTPGHVSRRLARARRLRVHPEELYVFEIIEGPNPIATQGCERHYLIKVGDLKVCLACGKSGMDHATPFVNVQRPSDKAKPEKSQAELAKELALEDLQPSGPAKFKPNLKGA